MKRGEREKGVLGHVHEDVHDVFVAAEITRNRLQVKIAEGICISTIPHYFQGEGAVVQCVYAVARSDQVVHEIYINKYIQITKRAAAGCFAQH